MREQRVRLWPGKQSQSEPEANDPIDLLTRGQLTVEGLLPWGSNYTFLGKITLGRSEARVVYKPVRGERPLWDFPRGTLAQREVAAYVLSEALGWSFVPPTVLREGPQGRGAVQLFVEVDQDAHFFTFREDPNYCHSLKALALFDVIINNADRKGGHCLQAGEGRIWAIDHGVCFNTQLKLRTVVWDFARLSIPEDLTEDLRRLQAELERRDSALVSDLRQLLSWEEIRAMQDRIRKLLETNQFPEPPEDRRPYPWPLI